MHDKRYEPSVAVNIHSVSCTSIEDECSSERARDSPTEALLPLELPVAAEQASEPVRTSFFERVAVTRRQWFADVKAAQFLASDRKIVAFAAARTH